jgi:two-component system sensor histidine kinase AlgZ
MRAASQGRDDMAVLPPSTNSDAGDDGQQRSRAEQAPRPTRFVVPDLCNAQALGVVVLVGELLVLVMLLAGGAVTWERFALMSLFVQWVGLTSAGALCWLRGTLANVALEIGAVISFLIVMLVTLIVGLIADRVLAGTFDVTAVGVRWGLVGSQLAISGIITGLVLRYFYVQQRLREQEQAELQARLQALQSRIRPHFLFNSMNIIASLIATDPDTAESVVEDLSELFRASLNDSGNQVPLDDEIELCERYIRIERLRLGERLTIEWDIDEFPESVRIPLLTLQPLLENAIYHGIQPLPEGGKISVKVRHEDDLLKVEITNPLPPAHSRDRTQGNRIALNNIRSRLSVLYGDLAQLTAGPNGDAFVTALQYPVRVDPASMVRP